MGTVNEDEFEQLVPVCEEAARPHGVVPDIHRKDFLFHFLIQNRSFPNTTRAVHYLCLLFIHPPAPWVGSQPCGAKYPGFCADSKGV